MKFTTRVKTLSGDFTSDRDWRILFGSFLILTILILVAAVYLYRLLDNLEAVSQQRLLATTPERLDAKALERAIGILANKKAAFDSLTTTPMTIVDPSR